MPRSQAQSDFSVARAPEVQLPAAAASVALSPVDHSQASASKRGGDPAGFAHGEGRSPSGSPRWILRLTVAALAALAVLCAVGPHIPAGE